MKQRFLPFLFILLAPALIAQTIDEKKAGSRQKKEAGLDVRSVNENLIALRKELNASYTRANELHKLGAQEDEFQELLLQVKNIKSEMLRLQSQWRESAISESKQEEEGYALWDQEETTLGQLILEYGAMDYLFIVPPEMATMKLSLHSTIPIPRESWSEVLEIILAHNGIGVKKLNPYTRQLFVLKQDPSVVQTIATSPQDLLLIPNQTRLFYLLTPPLEQVKSVFQFMERFADAKQTFVYQAGNKIALVSSKEEVEKLITLYDTVWQDHKGKIARVVPVSKMNVKEMEKILHSFFGEAIDKGRMPFGKIDQDGLTVLSLAQGKSLILIGQQEMVERAEKIVHDTEDQLQDPSEMTVFLYSCSHSDPTELAKLLEKVYSSLLYVAPEGPKENTEINFQAQSAPMRTPDGYAPTPPMVANPPSPLKPTATSQIEIEQQETTDHFIPDPKTGTILMVVRRDALTKIKDLLKRLDVPKKMVQIEVLLFEKRINNQNNFGLNLLKLGSDSNFVDYRATNVPSHHHGFDNDKKSLGTGILEFFFSGHKSKHFPAFELAYSFLMTQEDIQLNASPSITTVNQTPAKIAIVEEISINNGAAPIDTNKGIAFEKSFTRAQYGITIVLTPTIHLTENEDGKGLVTLQTDITFDTTKPGHDDRPLVDKRHIENQVRVVDGQTIILGGLRRKSSRDMEEKIPLLGEIPGIGKLFGTTKLSDNSTEMFFFITPKIIVDPQEELIQLRTEDLKKRPGDIPEFLQRVVEAREKESKKFFQHSIRMFWGN